MSARRWSALAASALILAAGLAILLTRGGAHRHAHPPPVATTPAPPPAPAPTPAPPSPTGEQFGANVNWLFVANQYTPAQVNTALAALSRSGATVARMDAPWELSEPTAPRNGVHRYDWTFDDNVATLLAAHGLTWLPIIDYSAPWDQSVPGQDHSPPASVPDFAAYAGAFAQRYGPGGTFWTAHPTLTPRPVRAIELWNEPDLYAFWYPHPDAARYAELYAAGRAAIKAVAPTVLVLIGGLTRPVPFLLALLAAAPQLRGQLDGVAVHPYASTPLGMIAVVRRTRATLTMLGLAGVPIYVTEFGWAIAPPGGPHYLPDSLRPQYIATTLAALGHTNCGVAAAVLYTWATPGKYPTDAQQWFGVDPPGSGSSADVAAFGEGIRSALAPSQALNVC
jgi:hypothetical protein